MKHFKQWLLHNDDGSLDTRRNIGMILEDLRDETVSISGGLIKITFPFLGTVCVYLNISKSQSCICILF